MKRALLVCNIITITLLCFSCKKKDDGKLEMANMNVIVENNTEPEFTDDDYWPEYMIGGMIIDDTGENVKAYSEKEVYSTSDEYISCILESSKKGTGFYYYGIPYIEKLEGEEWIRLQHNSKNLAMDQWCICAIEDAEDRYFSCKLTVTADNISPKFMEGTYRFVIFLKDRVIYALFDIEGGK